MDNRCVYCNEVIPEGRWICPDCEEKMKKEFVEETEDENLCRRCEEST